MKDKLTPICGQCMILEKPKALKWEIEPPARPTEKLSCEICGTITRLGYKVTK